MSKFQDKINLAIINLRGAPYVLSEWDTGFIIMTQCAFSKMTQKQQKLFMMGNLPKKGDKK